MKYVFGFILLIIGVSCNTTDTSNNVAYFGGEIINPKSSYVLLLKDNIVIDSLALDENNRFFKKQKNLKEGLYTFKHGVEFQYIYFEANDSILVRLNTWDFDESLVFSGKGSAKNEFLISLFLQNEKDENEMYRYFSLDETKFSRKIDSLIKERTKSFTHFEETEPTISEGFKKLANAAIKFPLYRLKEMYPYFYKKAHKLATFPTISESFYEYRNKINLNDASLVSFYPYQNYVVSYMYYLSHKLKEVDSSKSNLTQNLLYAVIDNITLEDFKNNLLKRIVVNDFLKGESTCTINKKTLDIFLKNCSNDNFKHQITNLVNDSKAVTLNAPLDNFKIISYVGDTLTINDVLTTKNTMLYFWSPQYMSVEYLENRITYLEKKYPNTLFIGIAINTSNNTLEEFQKLNKNNLFKLTKNSTAHTFLTSNYPRVILINNKGIVKNGFTYLDSKKLEHQLKKLEKTDL
ncbi:TlpA family protein disulfide reductase [Lutibacter sp.]